MSASHVPTAPLGLLSAVLGTVSHRRPQAHAYAFSYASCLLALRMHPPLPPAAVPRGFGLNRPARCGFRDRDHGLGDGHSLRWLRGLLHDAGINDASGEIWLYTLPRLYGIGFKPVSFWCCRTAAGLIRAVVCEVNNTFGERHVYVLRDPGGGALRNGETLICDKQFHVSPFLPRQGQYVFRFWFGPQRFLARIAYYTDTGEKTESNAYDDASLAAASGADPTLLTSVQGRIVPLDAALVRHIRWRYALQSLAVLARIHWHAAKLWWRGAAWHRQPTALRPAVTLGAPATSSCGPHVHV